MPLVSRDAPCSEGGRSLAAGERRSYAAACAARARGRHITTETKHAAERRWGHREWSALRHLRDDAVRALAWCIGAPGLMAALPGLHFASEHAYHQALDQAWPWLRALDENPTPLHERLAARRSWKVGIYFESLLSEWLCAAPQYELLGRNVQIRDNRRTLGAFDFLLRSESGPVQHWEVAVKFYLQRHNSADWGAWVGPNQRDRLDIKLTRMRDHQLPLSARPEAAEVFTALGIAEPPDQVALLKGMFFAPWNHPERRPDGSAAETPAGQWVTVRDFPAFADTQPACRWCVRQKPDWLGPARRGPADSFSTAEARVRLQSEGLRRPQLWSRLREQENDIWFEDHRLFVLPDRWPTDTRAADHAAA